MPFHRIISIFFLNLKVCSYIFGDLWAHHHHSVCVRSSNNMQHTFDPSNRIGWVLHCNEQILINSRIAKIILWESAPFLSTVAKFRQSNGIASNIDHGLLVVRRYFINLWIWRKSFRSIRWNWQNDLPPRMVFISDWSATHATLCHDGYP